MRRSTRGQAKAAKAKAEAEAEAPPAKRARKQTKRAPPPADGVVLLDGRRASVPVDAVRAGSSGGRGAAMDGEAVAQLQAAESFSICDWQQLRTLPGELGLLPRLRKLVCHDSYRVAELGEGFLDAPALEEVMLYSNNLPAGLERLARLRKLETGGFKDRELPEGLLRAPLLEELALKAGMYARLEFREGDLPRLCRLELSSLRRLKGVAGLEHLAGSLRELRVEQSPHVCTKMQRAGLAGVSQLAGLRALVLVLPGGVEVPPLAGLRELRSLTVTQPLGGVPPLAGLGELRALSLACADAPSLEGLDRLGTLTLRVTNPLPHDLTRLAALKHLDFCGNLPDGARLPAGLETLSVTLLANAEQRLPAALFQGLGALRSLVVHAPSLKSLPSLACGLGALAKLDLAAACGLAALPAGLGQLPRLEELKLVCAALETLPAPGEWAGLASLTHLVLGGRVDHLTPGGGVRPGPEVSRATWDAVLACAASAPALRKLTVTDPKRPSLSFPAPLPVLEEFYVEKSYRDGLASLPEELCDFPRLRVLSVAAEALKSLPLGLARLAPTLESLALSSNSMQPCGPPAAVFELAKLKTLEYMCVPQPGCEYAIPPEVGRLCDLAVFDMPNLSVTSVPAEVCDLPRLRKLTLRIDKLAGPLPEGVEIKSNDYSIVDLTTPSMRQSVNDA